jgi:Ca2+-binding EF-hand superfamily protein
MYFESKVKACYRVINDQDVVPTLTMNRAFAHVGTQVSMNEIGLWVEEEPEDDGEGGVDEFLTDHKLGNYMRLLDYFEAISTARHQVNHFEDKIQDVWEAYVTRDGNGESAVHRTSSLVGLVSPRAPTMPGTPLMAKILNEYFGVDEARAFLVEPEVLRLCSTYRAERFSYPIFVTACARLFFGRSDDDNWEAQSWARRYAEFAAYDVDNTNFLSRREFRQMITDMMPSEFRDPSVAQKFLADAEEQFKKMDVNSDQQISFQEYVVWHKLGGELSVKLHQEGALASPTTDDLHTHGHVQLLAQSMWRRRYRRSHLLSRSTQ